MIKQLKMTSFLYKNINLVRDSLTARILANSLVSLTVRSEIKNPGSVKGEGLYLLVQVP